MSNVTPLRARLELDERARRLEGRFQMYQDINDDPVKITMAYVWVCIACVLAIGLVLSFVH